MPALLRVAIGIVLGLGAGLVITIVVIAAKIGFFVNSPRAAHPLILIAFFVVPAAVGGLLGYRRARP